MLLTGNGEIIYFLPNILVFNDWMGNNYPNFLKREKDMSILLTGSGKIEYFLPVILVFNHLMENYYPNIAKIEKNKCILNK